MTHYYLYPNVLISFLTSKPKLPQAQSSTSALFFEHVIAHSCLGTFCCAEKVAVLQTVSHLSAFVLFKYRKKVHEHIIRVSVFHFSLLGGSDAAVGID